MLTKQDIEKATDIEEVAYKITLECCKVLVSKEIHGMLVEKIKRAIRSTENENNR